MAAAAGLGKTHGPPLTLHSADRTLTSAFCVFCKEHNNQKSFPTVAFPNAVSGKVENALWDSAAGGAAREVLGASLL